MIYVLLSFTNPNAPSSAPTHTSLQSNFTRCSQTAQAFCSGRQHKKFLLTSVKYRCDQLFLASCPRMFSQRRGQVILGTLQVRYSARPATSHSPTATRSIACPSLNCGGRTGDWKLWQFRRRVLAVVRLANDFENLLRSTRSRSPTVNEGSARSVFSSYFVPTHPIYNNQILITSIITQGQAGRTARGGIRRGSGREGRGRARALQVCWYIFLITGCLYGSFPPFCNIQMMRDLDFSLNFNFSRQNSNGWQNFAFDDNSQEVSLPKHHSVNNQSLLHFQNLLAEPPRPPASIYNCLESDQEDQGDIREVEYVQTEGEAKHVNSKQYFRMMKRRIKKVISEYHQKELARQDPVPSPDPKARPKYLHESRHQHAVRRVRGKDGKFLATRPENQRFREKKKRGRKPKALATPQSTQLSSPAP